jgi:3-deoxy-D-manno-octulosonate 8-phosphate phosphatase KdsC-like HAD superfamily phosphatase
MPPKYKITEDDADLVAERVHDLEVEDFEDGQHQREIIQDELADMRQVLEHIREAQRADRGIESFLTTSEVGAKVAPSEQDMIQMIAQARSTFHVKPIKTPLKYLVQIQW